METLNAIKQMKAEFPEVHTVLGVSNCSFGLKPAARRVLNSVFLYEAVEHGLDAAIVNARQILPLNRIPEEQLAAARDLIYDRRRRPMPTASAATTRFTTLSGYSKAWRARRP